VTQPVHSIEVNVDGRRYRVILRNGEAIAVAGAAYGPPGGVRLAR
jgi:hypothetical protein